MLSPQYILRKSLCRTPHCAGPYELRDTVLQGWPMLARETYLFHAESEIANLGYAPCYVESGYNQPVKGILLANWNYFCRDVADILERYGYSIEWSDEWTTCEDCGAAFRTSPDSYGWRPSGIICDSGAFCHVCAPWQDIIESEYEDNPGRAINSYKVNLEDYGYRKLEAGFESGFHPGQDDDPYKILTRLHAWGHKRLVFQIDDTGQFDIGFSVWTKADESDSEES